MARKSSLQKQREINLRGRSIAISLNRNAHMEKNNNEEEGTSSHKPFGPNGENPSKTRDIHLLTGVPELIVETDEEPEDEDVAPVEDALKQSNGNENRAEHKEDGTETGEIALGDMIQLENDDVFNEIEYWKQAVVCFILGANPP
ncbi:hypothetical protein vseg_003419 [Gypsophila vaccaria]